MHTAHLFKINSLSKHHVASPHPLCLSSSRFHVTHLSVSCIMSSPHHVLSSSFTFITTHHHILSSSFTFITTHHHVFSSSFIFITTHHHVFSSSFTFITTHHHLFCRRYSSLIQLITPSPMFTTCSLQYLKLLSHALNQVFDTDFDLVAGNAHHMPCSSSSSL